MSDNPNRRWYQFNLRTLLVLTTLVAALLGMSRILIGPAEVQRKAAESVERLGGTVVYAGNNRNWPFPRIRQWFPPDYCDAVVRVDWNDTPVPDDELAWLGQLRQLQELWLSDTGTSDAGLIHLAGLTQLKKLVVINEPISDAGLVHLQGLAELQYLFIGGTLVTDAGIAKLQTALPNCCIDKM